MSPINENLRWIGYCRKSTIQEDRQILSIEAQRREILDIASKQGIEVTAILTENQTAYKTGRVEFNKILSFIENGTINAIVVYHLSRLARNTSDGGRLIYLMDEGKLKKICTPTRTYFNNPDDKFFLQIEFGMNKKSSDDTSTYVKRDIGSKLLKGEYPAMVPIGYLNIDKDGRIAAKSFHSQKQILLEQLGRPLKRVEQDPLIAPILRKLFDEALKGVKNLRELYQYADEIGLRSKRFAKEIGKSQVYKILTNRFYYGMLDFRGESHEGVQDPIISKDEYDRIQTILHTRSRPRPKRMNFAFRGLLKCGVCGLSIVGVTKIKPSGRSYTYYGCSKRHGNCGQLPITETELENQIEDKLKAITISERLWQVSCKLLKESYGDQIEKQNQQKADWENQLRISEMKLKRLLDLRIEGGIDDVEYRTKRQELLGEKLKYEELVVDAKENNTNWLKRAEDFFGEMRFVYDTFKNGSPEVKRHTVARFGWNLHLKDGALAWEYKKPVSFLLEVPKFADLPSLSVGTQEKAIATNKNTSFEKEMSLWRVRRDSNPRSSP